jgi:hypothetical protein
MTVFYKMHIINQMRSLTSFGMTPCLLMGGENRSDSSQGESLLLSLCPKKYSVIPNAVPPNGTARRDEMRNRVPLWRDELTEGNLQIRETEYRY